MKNNLVGNLPNMEMDPAVMASLSHTTKNQNERKMSRPDRKKLLKDRAKAAARKDRRVGYDMEPEVIAQIASIAETNSTPASQVAQLALEMFLDQYHKGNIDLVNYRVMCEKNPRYLYKMEWKGEE